MTIRSFLAISNRAIGQPIVPKMSLWKAVAFSAGLGLSMLSYPVHAASATNFRWRSNTRKRPNSSVASAAARLDQSLTIDELSRVVAITASMSSLRQKE